MYNCSKISTCHCKSFNNSQLQSPPNYTSSSRRRPGNSRGGHRKQRQKLRLRVPRGGHGWRVEVEALLSYGFLFWGLVKGVFRQWCNWAEHKFRKIQQTGGQDLRFSRRKPWIILHVAMHQRVDHEAVLELAPPLIQLESLLLLSSSDGWYVAGLRGWILGWFGGSSEPLNHLFEGVGISLDKGCWVRIGIWSRDGLRGQWWGLNLEAGAVTAAAAVASIAVWRGYGRCFFSVLSFYSVLHWWVSATPTSERERERERERGGFGWRRRDGWVKNKALMRRKVVAYWLLFCCAAHTLSLDSLSLDACLSLLFFCGVMSSKRHWLVPEKIFNDFLDHEYEMGHIT